MYLNKNSTEYVTSIILTLLLLNASSSFAQEKFWEQKEFIIGTTWDPRISLEHNEYVDSLSFSLAKNANFNLLGGHFITNMNYSISQNLYILKIAERVGLSVLLTNYDVTFYKEFNSAKAEKAIDSLKKADHQGAFYGYNIGDEPRMHQIDRAKQFVNISKRLHPEKLSFMSALPIYAFESDLEYIDYIKEIYNDSVEYNVPNVVAYNNYPFYRAGGIRDNYFKNLAIVKELSGSKPFWTYVMTTKHAHYLEPTFEHLNFMAFCPISYGAKGLLYFPYESAPENHVENYTEEAVIKRDGSENKKYFHIQKINKYIIEEVGPIIMNSDYIGSFHASNLPTREQMDENYNLNNNSPVLSNSSNSFLLFGIFKDKKINNRYYVLMTNKHLNGFNNVSISIRGNHSNEIMLNGGYNNVGDFKRPFTYYNGPTNETFLDIPLMMGGELRIITIDGITDLYEQTIELEENILKAYPNPVEDTLTIQINLTTKTDLRIELISTDGKIVFRKDYPELSHGTHMNFVDVGYLNPGIYILRAKCNSFTLTKQLKKL